MRHSLFGRLRLTLCLWKRSNNDCSTSSPSATSAPPRKPRYQLLYYICSMNKKFTSSKDKMYFSVHFTKDFLLPFLDTPVERLRLKLGGTSIRRRVRLLKLTDGRATITTNWTHFVRAANIKEGEIFAFVFTVRGHKLRLVAHCL